MKRQTVLFFKKQYNLDCIRKVVIRDIENVDNSECYVDYDGRKIAVSFDKPSKCNIKGYISVSTKENKKETQCLENVSCTIDGKVAVHRKKNIGEIIVGYIKINGDTYAIVKKSISSKISLFMMITFICMGSTFIFSMLYKTSLEEAEKEQATDIKGKGSLDGEEKPTYTSEGFRFKINTSPIISDGKMNVRIESPEAENSEFVAVYDYYINAKVDVNYNVIEQYDVPINIYTSPEVYGNENLEYGTVTPAIDEGYYTGVCYCSIYDKVGNFLMTNGATIKIYSAE